MKKRKKRKMLGKHKKLPALDFLRCEYRYDPIKGILYRRHEFELEDTPIGYQDKKGYWRVSIKSSQYLLHRIVFYMYHGRDPGPLVIDHIDGNPSNNTILNLRAVKQRTNLKNTKQARAKGIIPELEPNAWKVLLAPVC